MTIQTIEPVGPAAKARSGALEPWDEHNRRLADSVRPPDWVDPVPTRRYHLVVVGGGTGGLVTAAIASALGARVALIERKLLGGDCLNVGCVPSKALIRAARAWHAAADAGPGFAGPPVTGVGSFSAVMERMRRVRADLSRHDGAARFRDLGVDVFLGEAIFRGPDSVGIGDQVLSFRRAVVATGSAPAVPPVPGLAEAGYLTNESIFSLTERPPRMVVIGGGPIGCELAQSFARFGTRVTLVEAASRVLPREDPDASGVVEKALRRDGIDVRCASSVIGFERAGDERIVQVRQGANLIAVATDHILVAAGRTPNVSGLGLEAAGVRFDLRRGIETDGRLRTTNRRIFAIGDVASRHQFTHTADAQARLVVRNALFFGRGTASSLVVPWCTFTSPEVAHVGMSHEEARARTGEVDTLTIPFSEVDRASLDGETDGFLRIHLKKGSDRILGATLVGEHAGDIISQVTQAMTTGTGIGGLGKVIFPYPTRAEILRKAADARGRERLTPRARRLFRAFFRVLG